MEDIPIKVEVDYQALKDRMGLKDRMDKTVAELPVEQHLVQHLMVMFEAKMGLDL